MIKEPNNKPTLVLINDDYRLADIERYWLQLTSYDLEKVVTQNYGSAPPGSDFTKNEVQLQDNKRQK